ncbi:folliculin, partial [Histoplasma capsulatum]
LPLLCMLGSWGLSLTHFCEVHGPTSILCSQPANRRPSLVLASVIRSHGDGQVESHRSR